MRIMLWENVVSKMKIALKLEIEESNRDKVVVLYQLYIQIANMLSEFLNVTIQPQKSILIRKMIEATYIRIIKLKADLVELDLDDWTQCGALIELQLPVYYRNIRLEEIDYKMRFIQEIRLKYGLSLNETINEVKVFTIQQAILLIQKEERARRTRHKIAVNRSQNSIRQMKCSMATITIIPKDAALKIQRCWRGFITKKVTDKRKQQELILIGMVSADTIKKQTYGCAKKYKIIAEDQILKQKQLVTDTNDCRTYLMQNQKVKLVQELLDQTRTFIHDYYVETGKIPDYRSVSCRDIDSNKEMSPSMDLETLEEEFVSLWLDRDDSNNPQQLPLKELINSEQMIELQKDIKTDVNETIRKEINMLQTAHDLDRGIRRKHQSAKKKARSHSTLKKSHKHVKEDKDLTPDRTTESLFEELIANDIIKLYRKTFLDEFKGHPSHFDHVPLIERCASKSVFFIGDMRQILKEYCILPLLVSMTPQSIMLCGPKGSGKTMLLHAICTELGAILIDLTSENLLGKYPGKSGLVMLLHLIVKVAKLLQPTVIYMENAEKPFLTRRTPKSDKSDPKRLKKDLYKLVKSFSVEDQVLFIGLSCRPWLGDQKMLQQVYQKFLYIPKPNYGTRLTIWSHLLFQYEAISRDFDFSGIARISDGYSIGSIVNVIKEVLDVKRVLRLAQQPLNCLELISALSHQIPIYKEEEEAFDNWYLKTPMCKRRLKAIEDSLANEEDVQK